MNDETPYGQAELPSGGERLLHERMMKLILRERETLMSYREERRRAGRTRFVLLGAAVILAATTVLLLFSPLDGAIGLAADALLLLLAAAIFFLFVQSSNNVREVAQRIDAIKQELASVEREIEDYHSTIIDKGND